MTTNYATEASRLPKNQTHFGLIPKPISLVERNGSFDLSTSTVIVCEETALAEASYLARSVQRIIGASSITVDDGRAAADVADNVILLRLRTGAGRGQHHGYRLEVSARRILIDGASNTGLFYGIQTLLQLMPTSAFSGEMVGSHVLIPCLDIEDTPRFPWRGALLDVARWYMPVDPILRFIDAMALHKLNTLHLHLNDDQGWRLEIPKYPLLTSVGAFRSETMVGQVVRDPADPLFTHSMYLYDGQPHGGFYTQDEMRDIVRYAAERHIDIVPEIDMPGHAQAAIAAYPHLGCTANAPAVSGNWGIHAYLFNPSEETISFLQDVLDDVLDIFPSRHIHLGGDEAVKQQWAESKVCQARIHELGLGSEEELQAFFMGRMATYLAERGRTLVGWDEILQGSLPPGAVVMSWQGEKGGIEAAMAGHDVVMTPDHTTYFDHRQSSDPNAEPMAFPRGYTTLETVYQYEPIPSGLPRDKEHHVLGSQGQLWAEYLPTARHVEYMAFPRLCALAEVTWVPRGERDYAEFTSRLGVHIKRLEALRINYRTLRLEDYDL